MKIAMGNDHSAIELKNIIKEFVESKGYEVIDLGNQQHRKLGIILFTAKSRPCSSFRRS